MKAIFDKEIELIVAVNLKKRIFFEEKARFNTQKKKDIRNNKVSAGCVLSGGGVITSQLVCGKRWYNKKIGEPETSFTHDVSTDVQISSTNDGREHFYICSGDWEYNTFTTVGNVYKSMIFQCGKWIETGERLVCL